MYDCRNKSINENSTLKHVYERDKCGGFRDGSNSSQWDVKMRKKKK